MTTLFRGIAKMSQKPETVFWQKIKPMLEALPNTYFERVQQTSIRGTPDVLMCVNGWFIALELKKDEDTPPDKLQQYKLDQINRANGWAVVCHPENWDQIYDELFQIAAVPSLFSERH